MSVKSRATITISRIIDVEAEIRYYLKQSSTLSTPAKPATYPPPSIWKTTEPDYSNDDTDTLYFVICTVFTNGTFKYSDVSKSSAYEGIRKTESRIDQTSGSITMSISTQIESVRKEFKDDTDKKLSNYVTNTTYTDDKNNTNNRISGMADNLSNKATKDDLKGYTTVQQHQEILKYMRFTENGLELGEGNNKLKLILDNHAIRFTNGGITIGEWDGTNFYTGDMVVKLNQRAQFGNFAFVPRSDKSLMFLKVQD